MIEYVNSHPYIAGIIAFLLGLACMPVVIKIAKQKHLVVRPNKRMSHTGEIPNIGGIDICFSFMLTYLIFEFNTLPQAQFLSIGVFIIMVVGLVDDILVLSPISKLLGELLAGISLIGFADIRLTHLHGFMGINETGLISSYILSFFVLIAIINAINLIDGVDGLASGLGIVYCLVFAIWFLLCGEYSWATLAFSLAGALLVYFCYNVFGHEHKIFMGDSGSLLLGYMLTCFVFQFCELNAYDLAATPQYKIASAPAVAICILSIPIFDTIRVSLTRIKHGRSPFEADKNHIHHLLLRTGLNHIQTTCVLISVSILLIGLGIIGRNWNMWVLTGTDFAICTILTIILWRIIDKKNAQR